MKIILNNSIELSPITVVGGKKDVQGAYRDTLTFMFLPNMSVAELDELFNPKNCESITIESVDSSGNPTTYVHKGYTVRAELGKTVMRISDETEESPAVYEERVSVVMGQRTYTEKQMEASQAQLVALLTGEG